MCELEGAVVLIVLIMAGEAQEAPCRCEGACVAREVHDDAWQGGQQSRGEATSAVFSAWQTSRVANCTDLRVFHV